MAKIKSKKYQGVYYTDLKNGDRSFYITYRDHEGKQKTVSIGKKSGGITEKFAFNERLKIQNQIQFGDDPNIKVRNKRKLKNVISFDMLATKYFENKALDIEPRSLVDIKSKYKNHIAPYIADMDIETIEKSHIEQIKRDKRKESASDPKKVLAPKTLNMVIYLITSIYNFAIAEKLYKGENIGSKIKNLKVDNERDRYLTLEEIDLLLNEVKHNYTLYTFCILSLITGGRVSTIVNIRKRDIDFKGRKIKLKDIKNNSTYYGFIKEKYFKYLDNTYNKSSIDGSHYLVDIVGDSDLYRIKNIQRQLKPIFDRLFNQGLDSNDLKNRVVTHTLRHTFASQLAIHNTPIFTIQKLMNHKDIKQTLRYAKLQHDSGLEFLNKIDF